MNVKKLSQVRLLSMDEYRLTILLGSGNEESFDRFIPLDVLKIHQKASKGMAWYFEGCDRIGKTLAQS